MAFLLIRSFKSFRRVSLFTSGHRFWYSLFVIFLYFLRYSIAFFCRSFNSNDSRFSGIWNFLKTTAKPPVTSLNIGSGKSSSLHHFIMSFVPVPHLSIYFIRNRRLAKEGGWWFLIRLGKLSFLNPLVLALFIIFLYYNRLWDAR